MSDLPYPPLAFQALVDFGVKEAAPFRLAVALEPADAAPGTVVTATVTATRTEGFAEEIAINPPAGLPPMVAAPKIGPIPKGKTETKFTLDVNAKTPIGDYFVLVIGKAKVGGRDVLSDPVALALPVGAPFDLAVEPGKLEIAAGGKATLKVTATAQGRLQGPDHDRAEVAAGEGDRRGGDDRRGQDVDRCRNHRGGGRRSGRAHRGRSGRHRDGAQ